MTCEGTYADLNDFAARFCDNEVQELYEAQVCRQLRLAAANIKAALAQTDSCDCTFADWATDYLIELNCVVALVTFWCPCSWIRQADLESGGTLRAGWQEWADKQLDLIRTGEIILCDGETGKNYPAIGWAQYSFTERNYAQIIYNEILEDSA